MNYVNTNTNMFCKPNIDFFYQPGEYAYAKCTKKSDQGYFFMCIDNYSSFFIPTIVAKNINKNIEENNYYWVTLDNNFTQNENTCHYIKAWFPKINSIVKEINKFSELHNKNDIIYAPIKEIKYDHILVNITPSYTAKVYTTALNNPISNYNQNDIKKFKITDLIKKDDKKIDVFLTEIDDKSLASRDEVLWSLLPKSLNISEVIIPNKIIETLKERDILSLFILNKATVKEDNFNSRDLALVLNDRYISAYNNKKIIIRDNNKSFYFMEFNTEIKDNNGAPIFACFKKSKQEKNSKWVCNLIGFTSAEREFEKYIYVDNWQSLLDELFDLVLSGENWDLPGNGEHGKHFILKQYLRFTFYKVHLDGKIVEKDGNAIFDTGLVDQSYDNIYCFLKKNEHENDFYSREWNFGFFAAWGKGEKGKKINGLFAQKPEPPKYIDRLENIFFDTDKELYCDYEHIILDNADRLPIEFFKAKLYLDETIQEIAKEYENANNHYERNKIMKKIKEYIKNEFNQNNHIFKDIQLGLKQAVDTAIKYCKWNYKTAIPIYYPRVNNISLLLPLCLTNNDNKADVALVIQKLDTGNYQGQTILTLDMAYQDARQICRPNSEWLTTENIEASYSNDCEDDLNE